MTRVSSVSRVRSVEERSSSVAVSSQLTVVQLVHLVTTRTHTQNGPPLNYREIDRDVMRSRPAALQGGRIQNHKNCAV